MKKQVKWLGYFMVILVILALVACSPPTPTPTPPPPPIIVKPPIKNPDTYIQATIGDVTSLDPAWAYDTASVQVLLNIYETLIFFKGGSATEFEPRLATEWVISPNGKEYRFKIRKGVKSHDGTVLTPSDVGILH